MGLPSALFDALKGMNPGASLLALNGNTEGDSQGATLFDELLSQIQTLDVSSKLDQRAPRARLPDALHLAAADKKELQSLSSFVQKWREHSSKAGQNKVEIGSAEDKSPVDKKLSPVDTEAPEKACSRDEKDDDKITSIKEELSDILSELQALLQMLQKPEETIALPVETPAVSTDDLSEEVAGITAEQASESPEALPVADIGPEPLADEAQPETSWADMRTGMGILGHLVKEQIEQAQAEGKTGKAVAAEILPVIAQFKEDLKTLLSSRDAGVADEDEGGNAGGDGNLAHLVDTKKTAPETFLSATAASAAVEDKFWNVFNTTIANLFGGKFQNPFGVVSDKSIAVLAPHVEASIAVSGAKGDTLSAPSANTLWPVSIDTVKSPYAFASQLSATRAMNGGTAGLPSAVDQVILQLHRGVKNGDDQMTIQLNPAELGRIHIKLNVSPDGKVHGTVLADNPGTLNMLLKDVGSLERALQEAGLRADSGSLQFNLSGQAHNPHGQRAQDFPDFPPTPVSGEVSAAADQPETWYIAPGRVNMKV